MSLCSWRNICLGTWGSTWPPPLAVPSEHQLYQSRALLWQVEMTMVSLPFSALPWRSSGGPVLTSHGTHVYLVGTHPVLGSVGGIQHWTYKVPQRRDVQSYTSRCTLCRVSVGVGGCACASVHACPREDVHTHRDGYLNCKWQLSNFEEPPQPQMENSWR